ncbi:hypothetical protein K2224_10705 [Streptomyces sp. BHT-5-2]|uniref:hypothetical protein n=1 Tax=Streptomyces sp. BHT-5-2 TaxID=2866715 RepID=UPI001C8DB402|nr:hypothetical protein [Streptomyces sp. BHT-5-2]QZL07123.1 hypothetical protein K2224_10705 [Streptomyces sp. BHT-5-2]
MTNAIASFLIRLLRLTFPARGRHRSPGSLPVVRREHPPTPYRERVPDLLLRGEDTPLVRPYVLTAEERRERRLQRERRRTLWLAVHGIDVGPRRIHGVEVAA